MTVTSNADRSVVLCVVLPADLPAFVPPACGTPVVPTTFRSASWSTKRSPLLKSSGRAPGPPTNEGLAAMPLALPTRVRWCVANTTPEVGFTLSTAMRSLWLPRVLGAKLTLSGVDSPG